MYTSVAGKQCNTTGRDGPYDASANDGPHGNAGTAPAETAGDAPGHAAHDAAAATVAMGDECHWLCCTLV